MGPAAKAVGWSASSAASAATAGLVLALIAATRI
jgi:hypothetical protein